MRLVVRPAISADDPAIRDLLRREPMPGRIRLTYQREPDFGLGCEMAGDDCRVLVAVDEESGALAGVACRWTRNVYINGHEQRIGYLGQLRIDSRFQGRWLVSRGFSLLKRWHDVDPLPAYLAAIVEGNYQATGVLVEKGRWGFPRFHAVAEYRTLAIDTKRAKPLLRADVQVSAPGADELADVAEFLQAQGRQRQFFQKWTCDGLARLSEFGLHAEDLRVARRGGEIAGVAALWDQSAYKQTIVQSYSGWLKALAPLYNLVAPGIGRAALPRPGEELRSAYVSLVCIANSDIGVFRVLLRDLYNLARIRRLRYMLVGLDSRDPLLAAVREYSHVLYPSRLYLAEWPDGEGMHEQLDGRPAYVEIATL
jgi:hypothetical protein